MQGERCRGEGGGVKRVLQDNRAIYCKNKRCLVMWSFFNIYDRLHEKKGGPFSISSIDRLHEKKEGERFDFMSKHSLTFSATKKQRSYKGLGQLNKNVE